MHKKISIFWFRRDLRLYDNVGLTEALNERYPVLPIFIFDQDIIEELPRDDARVNFIYDQVYQINKKLKENKSSLMCLKGNPLNVWRKILETYEIEKVFINKDYEPYARKRDHEIIELLNLKGIDVMAYKDQVIHEELEVTKADGKPYTVFTPYKKKWLELYSDPIPMPKIPFENFFQTHLEFPSKDELNIQKSNITVREFDLSEIGNYDQTRNYPHLDATSYLSPHLRFGTIGIRELLSSMKNSNETFISELIWREFFMQILYNFPNVVNSNFKKKYNSIQWKNDKDDFNNWCEGKTGYPMVDAGMRQLNSSGYMHNRVRMITAGFLCKHLLIDWRWGEAYFAKKLLDFELSSNNGNWQWAAGTGCDSAPYFRIFNPHEQLKKFDKSEQYIRKWIPEYGTEDYSNQIVEHKFARLRALETYKKGLEAI
jgi:deoxyribodipyrimidine photo-lyase